MRSSCAARSKAWPHAWPPNAPAAAALAKLANAWTAWTLLRQPADDEAFLQYWNTTSASTRCCAKWREAAVIARNWSGC